MKKFWSLLTVLILAAMIMSACATATTQAPAETAVPPTAATVTEVTFWHAYGTGSAEEVALTKVLAQAAIDMPQYKINVLQVPFNDIFNKYRTDVAAGGGPDMFVAPNDSLGDDIRAGLIADITDLAMSKLGDYGQLAIQGMQLDGKLYGIPESLKAVVFWYDKTKITTPPATTDELKNMMSLGTPIGISFSCYHYWGFYNAFGGKIFDENWNIVADQGTGITEAMTYLNDLYQIAKTNGWPKTDSDGLAPFQEGKIYGITNGNWAMQDYRTALGDNLALAPLPSGPGGVAQPLLGVDGYYINPNSQNKEAAINVALYLTGAKSETEMMVAGHVPAINTANVTDPLLQALVTAFKNGYVRPQVPNMAKYWANFCGSDQIFEKGVDPATWVKDATAAANK
jgi:arabinogalactan oligomer / maltooligosaccharide transport system substrate-binding protein